MNKINFFEYATKILFIISAMMFYIKIQTDSEIFNYIGAFFLILAFLIVAISLTLLYKKRK